MKPKNCLIFGASGQIGRNLIRSLTQNNIKVTAFTRNIHQKGYILKTQANPGYLEIAEGSIFDHELIEQLFNNADLCVNLIGILFEKGKNNFNNILQTNENISMLNQKDINEEVKYYNSSDFKKFDQLKSFPEYNDNKVHEDKENISSKVTYKSSDYGEFNKIIQTKNNDEKIKEQNKKIKVIDYSKLKNVGKKLKNKIGIEKIKIVYFD